MKRRLSLLCPLAVAALTMGASAQPVVFTQWRFNNQPTNQVNNSPAPSTGHGTAVALGMTNNYEYYTSPHHTGSFTTCDITSSGASGDIGAPNNCWRVRGGFDGTLATAGVGYSIFAPQFTQGAEFDVSTLNYAGVVFTFDWFTTNQGVHNMQVQYSIDAGANWTSTGPILLSATNAWINGNIVDLTGVTGVDDNPNFRIRMVTVYDPSYNGPGAPTYTGASGGQYNNASGNWRFDRVTFTGTPLRSVDPAATGAVSPSAVCASGGDLTFTVTVENGVAPISTGVAVTADLSNIGLSATQQFYDDGTHGDLVIGDNIFTFIASVPAGQTPGNTSISATASDAQGRMASTTIPVAIGDCSGNSTSRVVISQLFGGGGNLGEIPSQDAPYDADYVVLFNRSALTVSLDGWSIQYASQSSAGGFDNTGDQVILSGNVQPGQHILIRMSDPVPGFDPLPTPDFAQLPGFGGMGNTGGRVALVRSTTLIGTNYNDPSIEDFVGYGSGAATFEGAGPAPTPNPVNSTANIRKQGGTQDSNQNFNDFAIGAPHADNRASGGFLAGYPAVSPGAVCAGSNVTLTVTVSAPGSTGVAVTANLSSLVGTPTVVSLFDDGTHGDQFSGDGIYTLDYTVPTTAPQSTGTVLFSVSDQQGRLDTSSASLAIGRCSNSTAPVVISQVYGGGGNDLSGFNGDFAEIFNRSSSPVDMTGWSFQSARISDQGFDSRICLLSGVINPGEYRLIITNQLSNTGAALPPADFAPATLFGMESQFGRVCLVSSTNLVHQDYTRADVVDLVGYGSATQSFEGVGPTGTLSDILVAVRKDGGCQDMNQNAIDFDVILAVTLPHNSSSPPHHCPVLCPADFNHDGIVNSQDYFDFLTAFFAFGPTADFNHDGVINSQDFFDFITAFFIPCP